MSTHHSPGNLCIHWEFQVRTSLFVSWNTKNDLHVRAVSKLGFQNPPANPEPPRRVRKVSFQSTPPSQKPAIPAPETQHPTKNRQNYRSLYHTTDPYLRKPTMQFENPLRKKRGGARKLRYNSHYGVGGEHLDTRTKSTLLYHHCFG